MIDIKNASCIKDNKVIFSNIDLTTNAKTIGIIGENGIGKSTFLLQFMGVNTRANKFMVLNHDLLKEKNIDDFSIVFQDAKSTLNPLFDIGRLMLFLAKDRKISNVKEKTLSFCEKFNLKDVWHSNPYELSIGESKKISLIMALVKQPKLLILDELSAGLDEKSLINIMTYLKELDINIILTSHDKRFLSLCDEIYEFKGDSLARN